jgi:hypothetical protein
MTFYFSNNIDTVPLNMAMEYEDSCFEYVAAKARSFLGPFDSQYLAVAIPKYNYRRGYPLTEFPEILVSQGKISKPGRLLYFSNDDERARNKKLPVKPIISFSLDIAGDFSDIACVAGDNDPDYYSSLPPCDERVLLIEYNGTCENTFAVYMSPRDFLTNYQAPDPDGDGSVAIFHSFPDKLQIVCDFGYTFDSYFFPNMTQLDRFWNYIQSYKK